MVTLDDVRAAAVRIRGVAMRTPLLEAGPLALKCENLQPMGAFKVRGACNMIAQLPPESRARGVITYSSGNHGQAVALVAQRFGVPAIVVMPETAPSVKVEGVRRYGAEVIFAGTTTLHRKARAEDEAARRGLAMVPPFDDPQVIAGQGTVGLEILEQRPNVTEVFVPAGGGGLLSGVSVAIKGMRSGVRIIGVEPDGAAKITRSRAAGHPVTLEHVASIADGLLAVRPGDVTFEHVQALVDDVMTVTDDQIRGAVRWLFSEASLVAEPSGAAAVAGALARGPAAGTSVAIISGGNVDPAAYATYISQQF
jgi:threonine dehydratase